MKTLIWLCRGNAWQAAFILALLVFGTTAPYLLRNLA
jgi:hypothetical protein